MSEINNEKINKFVQFGIPDSNIIGIFFIKCICYIIPAIILGYSIEKSLNSLKKKEKNSNNLIYYIIFQIIINILILYILFKINNNYTKEFQDTIAGLTFVAFYFSMQPNLYTNIQTYIDNLA